MRRWLCFVFLFVLGAGSLGGLYGCSQSEPICQKDDDCPSGWICRQGDCAKSSATSCQRDKDCPSGQRCELASGQCFECLKDDDCNVGYTCFNRSCRDGLTDGGVGSEVVPEPPDQPGTLCKSDSDCKSGERCELSSGACLPEQGNQCKTDNDCAGDKYCVSGSCVSGRRPCQNDVECNGGFYCEGGFCYRTKCQSNSDCPLGKSCDTLAQQCKESNPQDCAQTGCPQGQVCNPSNRQCEAAKNCTQAGCPSGQTCNATTGQCESGSGQDCTQSGCPSGQVCNSSTKQCEAAQSGCTSDATCIPPNGTCKNGACVNCQQVGCSSSTWCNPSTGRCIATPPACTSNADCKAPSGSCISGGCLSCASQFSCPSNKVCNRAEGLCEDPPCSSDANCSPPQGSCQSGKCLSCNTDFTCPTGQPCNASTGRCGSAPPTCTTDSQCAAPNGTCRSGVCVSCSSVGCPSGQTCSSSTGRCSTSSSSCVVDSQCSSPLGWCRSGLCTSCIIYSCPSGQSCNSNTGQCTTSSTSCSKDTDCSSPNGWCRSSQCTTCRYYSCGSHLSCNSTTGRCEPKSCSSNNNCSAPKGACYNGKCLSCDGDFLCPFSQVCDKASGLCQPKPQCVRQSDCSSGKACLGGQCVVSECGIANPCSDGQVCENRVCRSVYTQCYSYLCGAKESCLYGPDQTDRCHLRCGVGGSLCPTGQECLSVKLVDGKTERYCFNKASLDANKSCKPGNLSERCKNQGSCLLTSSFSTAGYCYDACTPGSSLGCKSTQECVEFAPGKGLCLSKGSGSSGSSCQLLSSRCKAQFVCVLRTTSSTYGTCRARCSTPGSGGASAGCASGETCVASPYSRTGGVCIPDGVRSDGSSCQLFSSYNCKAGLVCSVPPSGRTNEGICRQRCQSASNCSSSSEDCVDGACMPKATGSEGASCRFGSTVSSYHCKAGLQCFIPASSTSTYGTCYKPCTRDSDCTSNSYGRCSEGVCQDTGTRSEYSSCGSSACKSSLVCTSVSSFSKLCLTPCTSNSDCNSSYPECSSGVCLKKGTIAEDSYCSDSYTSRCAAGLQCARPPGSSFSSRRCFRSCTKDSDCTGQYKVCKASSDGSMVCYK